MSIDIVIGLLLAFAIYRGYRRGAFEMIASFVIFIAALLLASAFGTQVGRALMHASYWHPIAGFFIVFVGLLIIGSFFTKSIKPKKGLISLLDRIAGAFLSGVRMLIIIGLVAASFRLFHLPSAQSVNKSKLYGIAYSAASSLVTQIKPLATTVTDDIFNEPPPEPTEK